MDTDLMDSYGIEEARLALGEIVNKARLRDEPARITRKGSPAAVVVSIDYYERAERALALIGDADAA